MEVSGYSQLFGYQHSSKYLLFVQQLKESHTGLEQFEGLVTDERIFIFRVNYPHGLLYLHFSLEWRNQPFATTETCQYTPFFKFKSTNINLLSILVCLSQNCGRFGIMIGQITCQSNSWQRTIDAYSSRRRKNILRTKKDVPIVSLQTYRANSLNSRNKL